MPSDRNGSSTDLITGGCPLQSAGQYDTGSRCFITSVPRSGSDMAPLAATAESGLKVPSAVRFDKLATLDGAIIAGRIGAAPADRLRAIFFGVFGFRPTQLSCCSFAARLSEGDQVCGCNRYGVRART